MGTRRVAVIDPGPDVREHVRALASAVAEAESVTIVVTHGHADHAAAARPLADLIGAPVVGPAGLSDLDREMDDGETLVTDTGVLIAVDTPGHAEHHLSFEWPEGDAVFVGDMMLGEGDTTWVAEYPGCVADYLRSLARLRSLEVSIAYPTHGPRVTDLDDAIGRYERHRLARVEQARAAMAEHPGASVDELLDAVYGDTIEASVRPAARMSLQALVDYVEEHER